jgi:hypothetical protein
MTPYQIIKDEEIHLLERLKKEVADQITKQVQNFIDKTGVKITEIDFCFLDVSTIDKKQITFQFIRCYKEDI